MLLFPHLKQRIKFKKFRFFKKNDNWLRLEPDPTRIKLLYLGDQTNCSQRADWPMSHEFDTCSVNCVLKAMTLDPAAKLQQSDRTSGFTSPSHFSSPSFPAQAHLYSRAGASLTPDSMVGGSPVTGDLDCISDTSSVSSAGPLPTKMQTSWAAQTVLSASRDQTQPPPFSRQRRTSREEEGSHTHTGTLKPRSPPAAPPLPAVRPSSLEDPVILSL